MVGVTSVLAAVVGLIQLLPMVVSNTCTESWRWVLVVDTSTNDKDWNVDFVMYSEKVIETFGDLAEKAKLSGKSVDLAITLMLPGHSSSGIPKLFREFRSSHLLFDAARDFRQFYDNNFPYDEQYNSELWSGLVEAEKMLEKETGFANGVKTGIIFAQNGRLREYKQHEAQKTADEIKKKGTKIYIFLWNPEHRSTDHAEPVASPGRVFSSADFGNNVDPAADRALFNALEHDTCPSSVKPTTARTTNTPTPSNSTAPAAPANGTSEKESRAQGTEATKKKKSGVVVGVVVGILAVVLIVGAAAGAFVLKKRRDSARQGSPVKPDAQPSARMGGTSKRQGLSTRSARPKSSRSPSRSQSPASVKQSLKSGSPSKMQSPASVKQSLKSGSPSKRQSPGPRMQSAKIKTATKK